MKKLLQISGLAIAFLGVTTNTFAEEKVFTISPGETIEKDKTAKLVTWTYIKNGKKTVCSRESGTNVRKCTDPQGKITTGGVAQKKIEELNALFQNQKSAQKPQRGQQVASGAQKTAPIETHQIKIKNDLRAIISLQISADGKINSQNLPPFGASSLLQIKCLDSINASWKDQSGNSKNITVSATDLKKQNLKCTDILGITFSEDVIRDIVKRTSTSVYKLTLDSTKSAPAYFTTPR